MSTPTSRDTIVDAALRLANRHSWESLRLHEVAADLHIPLNEVRQFFNEKEAITEAWFDRADEAMLRAASDPGLQESSPRERLQRLILAWLTPLATYRHITREMIFGKLEPGHVHYQFAGLLRVSRTVQWMREAAHCNAVMPWRAFEEVGLTGIYLATFVYWMRDDSENSVKTSIFLDKLLNRAERLMCCRPTCMGQAVGSQAPSASPSNAGDLAHG